MLFNSFEFLVFFPTVAVLFFALPFRFRWVLLLGASYFFYASWRPEYLLLILASTGVDYWAGHRMGSVEGRTRRVPYLLASLTANLGLLFFFKYWGFFERSVRSLVGLFTEVGPAPDLGILLPVGISFYTFQTLSYTIDVFRGEREPEPHLGYFALYVAFFPQLVAGPIERSTRLLPQLQRPTEVDWERIAEGLRLMVWGFFKKLVIADRAALYVDAVYGSPASHQGVTVILATYFFAFQIYCDFSGYSDIAIGAGKVLGYDLMENFRRPYHAASIREFWRRWHISLSTWFRDYVYIPLGGSRVRRVRLSVNLLAVFVVSGLWHGAAWTFVIWGAMHGLLAVASFLTSDWRDGLWTRLDALRSERGDTGRLRRTLGVLVTFHLVLVTWVFFRAETLSDAMLLLRNAARLPEGGIDPTLPHFGPFGLAILLLAILVMEGVHRLEGRGDTRAFLSGRPVWVRWAVLQALLLFIVLAGVFEEVEFIYFQF